jgi:penicillin-binding protein 1A
MLSNVVRFGTGAQAQVPGWQIAGKTGTSASWRDAWFVGYSARLVGGVWIGNDDDRATRKVTGGGAAAALFRKVMMAAHRGLKPEPLLGAEMGPLWLDATFEDDMLDEGPEDPQSTGWSDTVIEDEVPLAALDPGHDTNPQPPDQVAVERALQSPSLETSSSEAHSPAPASNAQPVPAQPPTREEAVPEPSQPTDPASLAPAPATSVQPVPAQPPAREKAVPEPSQPTDSPVLPEQ